MNVSTVPIELQRLQQKEMCLLFGKWVTTMHGTKVSSHLLW